MRTGEQNGAHLRCGHVCLRFLVANELTHSQIGPTSSHIPNLTKIVVNSQNDNLSRNSFSANEIEFRRRGGFTPSDVSYWNRGGKRKVLGGYEWKFAALFLTTSH